MQYGYPLDKWIIMELRLLESLKLHLYTIIISTIIHQILFINCCQVAYVSMKIIWYTYLFLSSYKFKINFISNQMLNIITHDTKNVPL